MKDGGGSGGFQRHEILLGGCHSLYTAYSRWQEYSSAYWGGLCLVNEEAKSGPFFPRRRPGWHTANHCPAPPEQTTGAPLRRV